MACLWNLEDTYYLVNNQPCTFFNGVNEGLHTQTLVNINTESIQTLDGKIFKFADEVNGVYTDCCIIPDYYGIFKTELTAKTYMGAVIDAHKAHIETFRPA